MQREAKPKTYIVFSLYAYDVLLSIEIHNFHFFKSSHPFQSAGTKNKSITTH